MLCVHNVDVLENPSDALVLTFDGTAGPTRDLERILGNVARQFIRRFPEVDLLDHIEGQVDFPVPLGTGVAVDVGAPPFPLVNLVSTLHHLHTLDERGRRAVAQQSFSSALQVARKASAAVVATTILQGGWRLPPIDALSAMLSAPELGMLGTQVNLHIIDPNLARDALVLARSLGLATESVP